MLRSVTSRVAGVLALLGVVLVASCSDEPTGPKANRAPVATIKTPVAGAGFGAGQSITYSGVGADAEDGAVPATRMAWWIEVQRGSQVQLVMPRAAGKAAGTFVVPLRDGLSVDMKYRIHLEVRDAQGLADTATRDLSPTTTTVRLETMPAGLQVVLDGATFTSPHELTAIVGMPRDVSVASPQVLGSSQWAFSTWSDGGERAHTVTPSAARTYRATFTLVPPANQPPTVALTSPTAGVSLVQGVATTLRATAADADGSVSQVQFYDGAVLLGSDATAPYELSWTPATAGAHSLVARAIDDDGAGTSSAPVAVTVTAPVNVPPTVSITGPSGDSTVAFGSAVTLRAQAADADGQVSSVAFFDGAALIGTVTTASYTLSWSPAAAGAHVVTARATDNVGATTTSSPVTVTVQPPANQPPTVALTAPAAGASLALGAPVVLAASAADADGAVARVEFLVAGAVVGTDESAPFQFTWTPAASGPVTLAARAADDDGAASTSAGVSVTVVPPPNQPPQVTLTAPANGATHTVGTPVTLRASATDADGTVARVEFLDGTEVLGTDTSAPFELTWTPGTLGARTLAARATDDDGAATSSAAVTLNVVPQPNTAPSVALTAPANGATVVLGTTVTLAATASDGDGTVTQVEFRAGTMTVGTDAGAPYSVQWTPQALGTHVLTARASDDRGAITTSAEVTITVVAPPNQAPAVSLTAPASGASVPVNAPLTLRATATDADGAIVQVQFLAGATVIGTVTGAPFEIAWIPTTPGSVTLTARATDDDGSVTTSSPVTVTVQPPPNVPPSVVLTSPGAGTTTVLGQSVTLAASASDADGTVARVDFLVGGNLVGSDQTAPFSVSWTPTMAGNFALSARATDDDGAETTSGAVQFAVLPPPNVTPSVSMTSPPGDSVVTVGTTVTLRATASDGDGTVAQVAFYEGATLVGTATQAPYATTWTPSLTGTHTITARATDDDGATTTSAPVAIAVVPVANQLPAVTVTAPTAGATLQRGIPVTLRASASDADGSVVRVDFLDDGVLVGSDQSAPFELAWMPTTAGARTLAARAVDDDGGTATSAGVAVTVVAAPNQAPVVALSAPVAGTSITVGTPVTLRAAATDADGVVARVEFLDGATSLGVVSSVPFELSWTPTTLGAHTLSARATDDSGAVTTSASITVTVVEQPNVAPTVTVTAPAADTNVVVGTTATLRATAADQDGTIASVAFLDGTTVLGTVTQAPFVLAWTPATTGAHAITARATDDDGAVTASSPVNVNVVPPPNVAPSVAVTLPTSGASLVAGVATTLRATATDADGSVVQVAFLVNGTPVGTVSASPFEVSWTPSATGAVTVQARATDDDGAITTSAAVSATVVSPPNVAPTVSVTAPTPDSVVTLGTAVTLRASAADADGSVTQVAFFDGATEVGVSTQAPFAVAWTPTSPGAHSITARATDDDEAVTTSAAINLTVVAAPNQAPTAAITSPAVNAPFRAGETITYAGTGSDPEDGALAGSQMTWWVDLHHDNHTHPLLAPTAGAAGGTLTLPTAVETSDNIWYRFYLVVRDAAGASDTVFHEIRPVKSTMRFETVPAGLQVTLEGQPRTTPVDVVGVVGTRRTLGAPATQTLNGTEYVLASWSDGGAASHDIATPENNTTFVATFTAVAPANQPPTVAVTAPAANALLTIGNAVTLTAAAADADGTVAQVAFFVDGVPVGTAATGPYQVSWTPSSLGARVITARATDDDGAVTTSAAISVTVQSAGGGDVTAPTVQLLSPANDARDLGGSILMQASASDDVGVAGVTFEVDGEMVGSEDTSAPYEVTLPSTASYASGQHVIRVRARDAAGNLSAWASHVVGFGGSVLAPSGFARTQLTTSLFPATTMAFAPDGRLFIAEQRGTLRVMKNGVLLPTPFHSFDVDNYAERGLLGIAFDPAFATNGWVYVYITVRDPARNMVVRVRANGDVSDPATLDTVFVLPNLEAVFHNGGALQFGPDGKLYVATGDNQVSANAQSLGTTFGKILRIEADGSIPADNPFYAQTTGSNRAIWARGLRNPFSFTFQPGTGRMFVNDVGEWSWEEINEGVAGANYGWPATEGPTTNPSFRSPLFAYPHTNAILHGFAIVGAGFYNPPSVTFPASYVGNYFFGDYVNTWVSRFDPVSGAAYTFAHFPNTFLLDVRVGPDGAVYVLTKNPEQSASALWRVHRQ